MAHIPQKQWDELTDKEKELLKAIGIRPNGKHKAPPNKLRGVKAPNPYTIKVITRCQLCKGSPVKYFDMVLSDENGEPHLHAVPICKEDALKKKSLTTKETYSSTCCECYERLHKWSKEELIKKLVKTYAVVAIGAGR